MTENASPHMNPFASFENVTGVEIWGRQFAFDILIFATSFLCDLPLLTTIIVSGAAQGAKL
jgi:hypothetical protein